MTLAQEKAAGMLPTSATASKPLYTRILPAAQKIGNLHSVKTHLSAIEGGRHG